MMDSESSASANLTRAELPDEGAGTSGPKITFMGNSYDLMSVIGVTVAGVLLFVCGTCNFGFYCLPVLPIIFGVVSLLSLKEAVDPDRTRLLSWISIGVGTAFTLLIVALILVYVLYFGFIFYLMSSGHGGY